MLCGTTMNHWGYDLPNFYWNFSFFQIWLEMITHEIDIGTVWWQLATSQVVSCIPIMTSLIMMQQHVLNGSEFHTSGHRCIISCSTFSCQLDPMCTALIRFSGSLAVYLFLMLSSSHLEYLVRTLLPGLGKEYALALGARGAKVVGEWSSDTSDTCILMYFLHF